MSHFSLDRTPFAVACSARCHLYIDDGPSCQPQHRPLDATHLLDASDAPFTQPKHPILARQNSTELRHCSASSSALTITSRAKLFRPELRHDILYLVVAPVVPAKHW